jgi:hypothetical protein
MRTLCVGLLLLTACSHKKHGGNADLSFAPDGFTDSDEDMSAGLDAFFVNDPPLMYCGPDGGTEPMSPGGTPMCPDDKNLPGCACPTPGATAACWTGLRKNRGLGICKDGTTTCESGGEFNNTWGPCNGEVLPEPGVTVGAEACECFSHGLWAIANTIPCFSGPSAGVYTSSYSSSDDTGVSPMCSTPPFGSTPWSLDQVTADCAGDFTLCYAIKAGSASAPSASDCTLEKVCTTGTYLTANVAQSFPGLPTWTSSDTTCIDKFTTTGGYGEMSVVGTSVTCDMIPEHVFQRLTYCPIGCTPGSTAPGCAGCVNGGSGPF